MQDFTAKRNALFACLDDASRELKGTVLDQTKSCKALRSTEQGELEFNYRQSETRNKHTSSQRMLHHLRGKESIFKKPELTLVQCLKPRKLPDHQINPHKWKKYSLEDVDISDHTNTTAAFEFLRQIDERNETAVSTEKSEGEEKKIEFKKSCKIRRNLKSLQSLEQKDAEIDSPKMKGSKLVMPEYIVGQTTPTFRKKPKNATVCSTEPRERAAGKLILSHLQEEDEDEQM